MIYSGIFSEQNQHPIKSAHTEKVISTGLSRAFSEIVRFNFDRATELNSYSIKLFLFFFIQGILRLFFSLLMFRNMFSKKHLVKLDILLSVFLFLWSFGPFIIDQL